MNLLIRIWPLLAFIFLVVLLPQPSMAGTMYLSGGPDLSVSLSGSNEISPGAVTSLSVMVENHGLIDVKMVRPELVTRDDLPNTAKLVRVGLGRGEAPLTVRSDPQMIGDLIGGTSGTISFDVKISSDAQAGTYQVPVFIEYTYLYSAESDGQDNIRYYYKTEQKTLSLNITIKSIARLEIKKVDTDHLNVGTEGYLIVTLKNTGNENANRGVLRIIRNGNSPVIPTDSSVYQESFPKDGEITARFKVSISSTAEGNQVYPIDIILYYENSEGEALNTDSVTFGVPVSSKVDFSIISGTIEIAPGQQKVIEVEYRNTGSVTVSNAQARISAVEPFTSSDDTAFLGDIAPGESGIARFEITTDRGATVKEYGLDSEIRYRDALDNSMISDTMKVQVRVTRQPGILDKLLNPLSLTLIAVGFIGSAWVFRGLWRRQ